MKRKIALFLSALFMASSFTVTAMGAIENIDPVDFINWYHESGLWNTVRNGHWSSDPADQISDEELELILSTAMLQQCAVHWTQSFFIVVKDVEEQRKIIGDRWGDPEDMATEGTVTVIVMADQILTMEEGHVSPYEGSYMHAPNYAYYDAGTTSSVMQMAAAVLGYQTHYFGSINGEYAPFDIADGKYQSMSRYVKDDYMRAWGMRSPLGGEINEDYVYPVAGNCVFVMAIVIGKPVAGQTMETWGTNYARPKNWAIWD